MEHIKEMQTKRIEVIILILKRIEFRVKKNRFILTKQNRRESNFRFQMTAPIFFIGLLFEYLCVKERTICTFLHEVIKS